MPSFHIPPESGWPQNRLTAEQFELAERISDVSEAAYCAAWMKGTEFAVWRLMQDGGTWGRVDSTRVAADLDAIRALVDRTGSWIVWEERDDGNDGQTALPLDEWFRRYRVGEGIRPGYTLD